MSIIYIIVMYKTLVLYNPRVFYLNEFGSILYVMFALEIVWNFIEVGQ